jgi:hypothetical protein
MAIGFEPSINNEAVRYSSGLDLFNKWDRDSPPTTFLFALEGGYLARFEKSYYSRFGKI